MQRGNLMVFVGAGEGLGPGRHICVVPLFLLKIHVMDGIPPPGVVLECGRRDVGGKWGGELARAFVLTFVVVLFVFVDRKQKQHNNAFLLLVGLWERVNDIGYLESQKFKRQYAIRPYSKANKMMSTLLRLFVLCCCLVSWVGAFPSHGGLAKLPMPATVRRGRDIPVRTISLPHLSSGDDLSIHCSR